MERLASRTGFLYDIPRLADFFIIQDGVCGAREKDTLKVSPGSTGLVYIPPNVAKFAFWDGKKYFCFIKMRFFFGKRLNIVQEQVLLAVL